MRKARNNTQRGWLYTLAMLCFAYIVAIAVSHHPLGLLSYLWLD